MTPCWQFKFANLEREISTKLKGVTYVSCLRLPMLEGRVPFIIAFVSTRKLLSITLHDQFTNTSPG